ncbi:MAG: hypothetical protein LBO09_02490 [Candidatus Peribacteria bacterium]|jgi:hypothetical protein|nr:hypothetical protein [Candidatus Peribacteria bacterium]
MNETFYQSADIKEQKNNGGVSPEPSIDQKYTNDPKYFANHSHLSKKVDDYFSNAKSPAMSGKGEEFWQRLNPVSNLQGLAKMQAEKKNKEKKQSLVEALTRENITQEEFDKILLDYFEQGIISQEQKVEVKEGV